MIANDKTAVESGGSITASAVPCPNVEAPMRITSPNVAASADASALNTSKVLEGIGRSGPPTLVAVPMSWEHAPRHFLNSMTRLDMWRQCQVVYYDGGTIYEMRNQAVDDARRLGVEGILFIDADMSFHRDSLARLVEHSLPIVSGLCRARRKPYNIAAKKIIKDPLEGEDMLVDVEPDEYTRGLYNVDLVGAAFLYIRMDVFDQIKKPYFMRREIENPADGEVDRVGEDYYFCYKARAAGIPIAIDLDLHIGHITTTIVTTGDDNKNIRLELE